MERKLRSRVVVVNNRNKSQRLKIREAQKKVLIITDSRGKGITDEINSRPSLASVKFDIKILPGVKLNDITQKIRTYSIYQKYDLIVVVAGICELTVKEVNQGLQILTYPGSDIHEIITKLNALRDTYGSNLILATITPASLKKYFEHRNPTKQFPVEREEELKSQQKALIEDIKEINSRIKESNAEANVTNIDLANLTQSRAIKYKFGRRHRTTKFTDKDLYDGVHSNSVLRKKWHKRTVDVIDKSLFNQN